MPDEPSNLASDLEKALQDTPVEDTAPDLDDLAPESPAEQTPTAQGDQVPPEAGESPAALSFRDQLASLGVDLGSADDDDAALQAVARQIQEGQQARQQAEHLEKFAQYGQQYLQHAGDFHEWLAQRHQQQQQQPPQPEDPFQPPEYDPAWLNQVERNERGELMPINGGTPETVLKLRKALDWQQKFWSDPYKHLEGFIDRRAEERTKKLLDERISQVTESVAAQQFLLANRDWLFESGKYDQQGNPQLTARGQQFRDYLAEANAAGFTPQQQQNIAMQRLSQWDELQKLKAQLAESSAAPPSQPTAEQVKEDILAKAAGYAPNSDASTNPPPAMPAKEQPLQNENMSLNDALRAAFKDHSVTEADIVGSI